MYKILCKTETNVNLQGTIQTSSFPHHTGRNVNLICQIVAQSSLNPFNENVPDSIKKMYKKYDTDNHVLTEESHLSVEPTAPPPVPQPYEVMRQVTRRATMRRSRKGSAAKVPPNEKLEAIKRGQKMLDARLAVRV